MISLFLILFKITLISSLHLETPVPSKHLQPRDFNPHPYKDVQNVLHTNILGDFLERPGTSNFEKTGPVQFPKNDVPQIREQQKVQEKRIRTDDQALENPYEFITINNRLEKLERFSGTDEDVLGPTYNSLSEHARKVLNSNQLLAERSDFATYEDDYVEDPNEKIEASASNYNKKKYKFSYAVKDDLTGDDYSHTQKQGTDGSVRGSYKVQLPDGRVQIVRYVADDNGYKADVLYEMNGVIMNEPNQLATPRPFQHQQPRRQPKAQRISKRIGTHRPRTNLYPKTVGNVEVNNVVEAASRVPPNHSFYYHPAIPAPFSYYQKQAGAPTATPIFFITTPQPRYNQHYRDIHVQPTAPPINFYYHPSTTPLPAASNNDY